MAFSGARVNIGGSKCDRYGASVLHNIRREKEKVRYLLPSLRLER